MGMSVVRLSGLGVGVGVIRFVMLIVVHIAAGLRFDMR